MISDIRLQNFRSYKDESFEFENGVNIVVGPNASGKTNLIEALMIICLGKSYRGKDKELIQKDKNWTRLDSLTSGAKRTVKIEQPIDASKSKKSFVIGGQEFQRLSFNKTHPVVIFEPEHLQLLTGSPELRRNFIDDLLEQTIPDFSITRSHYKRALAQRNAFLKINKPTNQQLFVWNLRLSELGGKIFKERNKLLKTINPKISEFYKKLAKAKTPTNIQYISSCEGKDYASALLKKLEKSTETDFLRGFTAYGPHREDFLVSLGNKHAAETASRGEIRTLLLAFKLMELQIIEEFRSNKPILLLDDVFSELDGARRKALTEFLTDYQTFITTTDADIVVKHFIDKANIIPTNKNTTENN